MEINDIAYMAGLFDGEGHVEYKKRLVKQKKGKNKAYKTWSIRCEMSMTDRGVMEWFHETLGFGTLNEREAKLSWTGKKTQWRWRCSYRDALVFAKLMWPYTQVKLHKLEQIIDHYEPDHQDLKDNVVDLAQERERRQT
jgi:hypothetical protein|tara:strand:+ start:33 stop:449 length:417 start_codon:yes stop_codon:yes gene_type:complete